MPFDQLKVKIAGEIALSPDPGGAMKKWREVFSISQSELSQFLKISPSTISDYESNRRKSPGIGVIKRFVDSLFDIDLQKGGEFVKRLAEAEPEQKFFDIFDFGKAIDGEAFMKAIKGNCLACKENLPKAQLFGCTIIDSVKVILELPYESFVKIYSTTSQRALLFTGTTTGRSPMVAVRIAPIKPAVVVLHDLPEERVDKLAVKIADSEGIPLIVTKLTLDEIKKSLKDFQ